MATPEITTMNGASSRRMACKLCRDRKVRCGGEQPACEKCRRAGEQCVYLPTQKPSKADLAQTIEELQKRLDEAEAYIVRLKASSNCTTLASPSAQDSETPPDAIFDNQLLQIVHASSDVDERASAYSINASNTLNMSNSRQDLRTSAPVSQEQSQPPADLQPPGRENGLSLFPMDEYMNIDSTNLEFCPQDGFGPQTGIDEETGAAILEPITKFSSAIFRNQAETLVMASVVADYIAWLRKAPPGGGIPTAKESPVYLGMLDNLEIRLRELCEMSQSKSTGALQELVAALEALAPSGGAMAARLGCLEESLQKESKEQAEVFRSQYNPCALLSQQSGGFETRALATANVIVEIE